MAAPATPEVLWAQRSSATDAEKNFLYVTITVPDVKPENLKIDVKSQSLTFSGHSDSLKRDYHVELEFYAEIDDDKKTIKVNHTMKNIQFVLRKKELKEEFWPRLLKNPKKVHFLKTDFDKWVDEDEQNEAPEEDLAGGMGGMGGMPGMGDMSSMMGGGAGGDFGGIDFSKLGGAGGLGGEEEEESGEEESDDEMPGLEGEEEAQETKPAAAKIEEVA
jgi:hypothetical protein